MKKSSDLILTFLFFLLVPLYTFANPLSGFEIHGESGSFVIVQDSTNPLTYLEMHSEPGDYIGQGLDYYFTEADGEFTAAQSYSGNPTYDNNSISLSFHAFDNDDWWYLSFSTHALGVDLDVGTYEAVRFPFEPDGLAGMSISGNGRGSNRLTGTFTVLDIDFGGGGQVNRFAATFEQHSEGRDPALFGTISYQSDVSPMQEFPLHKTGAQVNNSFTYEIESSGTVIGHYTDSYTVIDDDKIDEFASYAVETEMNGDIIQKDWRTLSGNELSVHIVEEYSNGIMQHDYRLDPGQLLYWVPNAVGERREGSIWIYVDDDYAVRTEYEAEVVELEPLSLSFGNVDAYKIHFRFTPGAQLEFYIWVVPYLGLVKYQGGETTEVLVDFNIAEGQITLSSDADGDLLKDWEEIIVHKTKAKDSDSDDDGLDDFLEITGFGTDPNSTDSDSDGIQDGDEGTYGTSPVNPDCDGDGISDGDELLNHGTDPLNPDSDSDGLEDGDEIDLGTDPLSIDTDQDNMPDEWEVTYGLDPLSDDSAEDFDGDLVSNLDEYAGGRHPANREPLKPVLHLPNMAAVGVSVQPTLYSEPIIDEDEDAHYSTRWQVSLNEAEFFEDEIVFNFETTMELLALSIPALILEPNTIYYWRVRYTDSRNATSEWSETRSFESGEDGSVDLDNNGVPDDQQIVSATLDLDQNGTPDKDQTDIRCVQSQTNGTAIGLKHGVNVTKIEKLNWVNPEDIADDTNRPDEFFMGLLNFKIETTAVGAQAEITVYLSEPAPANSRWVKYSETSGWQDFSSAASFSADRKRITVTLTDGGPGDLDGVANGFVVDPSGLAGSTTAAPAVSATASGGGGGGGGCFIATAAYGSKYEKHVAGLREFRDRVLRPTQLGRYVTNVYYRHSPPIAEWIKEREHIKAAIQLILVPVAGLSGMYLHSPSTVLIFAVFFFFIAFLGIVSSYRKMARRQSE